MKKVLISICMAFAATIINAQLVVDSLGRVGIGTETPLSQLSIGGSGYDDAVIGGSFSSRICGIRLMNAGNDANARIGIYCQAKNPHGNCFGGRYIAIGCNDMNSNHQTIGVSGLVPRAQFALGVFGGRYAGTYGRYAGICGNETPTTPSFKYDGHDFSGIYAGYFNGKVRVTNGIYATVLSPTISTSISAKNGTTILSGRGESVTDKLSQVQTVQFLRYDPTKEVETRHGASALSDKEIDKMSLDQLDSLAATTEEEPERYLSPVQYGLDAEQLKAVYPELVYEDANGNVSINYVEMVPLLVQSINELKKELAELVGTRRGASASREQKSEATGIEETVSDIDVVRMNQNNPNPFSESTVIALNIPAETQTANIFIYDMSGKQVQSLPVSERGETDITVYARDLAAGMYIYTLVADGKATVTRRMIVEL